MFILMYQKILNVLMSKTNTSYNLDNIEACLINLCIVYINLSRLKWVFLSNKCEEERMIAKGILEI